jgi:hypothetical protein
VVTFGTYRGGGTVTGEDPGFIGKAEEAGLDGLDDLAGIAPGQVGAADAAVEEGIAGNDHFEGLEVKADGALGVAGCMENLGGVTIEADQEAVGEAGVGGGHIRGGNADPGGLRVHHFEQGQVVFIEENGCSGEVLQLECAADMVDVGVGYQDLLDFEAEVGEAAIDSADFIAGVDDDGFGSFLVAQDGAVALQRADRECLEDHGFILAID